MNARRTLGERLVYAVENERPRLLAQCMRTFQTYTEALRYLESTELPLSPQWRERFERTLRRM